MAPRSDVLDDLAGASEDSEGPAALATAPWMSVATAEIGVHRAANHREPRILDYLATTNVGRSDDRVPWCSAFVNWCLKQADVAGTGSALARSWLEWGRECEMQIGAVVVLERGSESWQGHVGFVKDFTDTHVLVLGGNQSGGKNRPSRVSEVWFPRSKVLGCRRPRSKWDSKTVLATGAAAAGTLAQGAGSVYVQQSADATTAEVAAEVARQMAGNPKVVDSVVRSATAGSRPMLMITVLLTIVVLGVLAVIYRERVKKWMTGRV